jgi:hypothetical protein
VGLDGRAVGILPGSRMVGTRIYDRKIRLREFGDRSHRRNITSGIRKTYGMGLSAGGHRRVPARSTGRDITSRCCRVRGRPLLRVHTKTLFEDMFDQKTS